MSHTHCVDLDLAHRLETDEAAHWGSLLQGLAAVPGNPYGAEVKRFGRAIALVCPGMPSRRFTNRLFLAESGAELDEAAAYYRSKGLRFQVEVTPAQEPLLPVLQAKGFRMLGFETTLYLENSQPAVPQCDIRLVSTEEEARFAAWALPVAFDVQGETWLKWLTDSTYATYARPDWRSYVAYVDGAPAAVAQLHIDGSTACLAEAGTLPAYRGRGLQTALIQRRIADALDAGCDLVCTQTGCGTTSQHNMERAGFRIAYTKAKFYA